MHTALTSEPPVARAQRWFAAAWSARAGVMNIVAGALIMLATLPGRTQGLGLITEPMLRDLRLERVAYAKINLWATLLGAAACVPIGRLLDRAGLRWTTLATIVLLGAAVWQMSAHTGGAVAFFALVLATRALGQSALSVASITAVGKCFNRGVGVAMGFYSVLLTLLFAVSFTLVGRTVRDAGWRTAWADVAIALFVVIAPLVALLLREPVGTRTAYPELAADSPVGGLSLSAALRTPAFWVFAGATSVFGLVSSGLGLFNEAIFAERGFDARAYHQVLAGTTVIGLVGQLGCGALSVRWPMQRLLAAAMCIYAAALVGLPFVHTHAQLWLFAAMVGVSGGMIAVLFFAIWRRAFGSAQLGRIQGAAQMLTVVASAVGPLLMASSASMTGSYAPALWLLAPIVFILGVAAVGISLPDAAPRLASGEVRRVGDLASSQGSS